MRREVKVRDTKTLEFNLRMIHVPKGEIELIRIETLKKILSRKLS